MRRIAKSIYCFVVITVFGAAAFIFICLCLPGVYLISCAIAGRLLFFEDVDSAVAAWYTGLIWCAAAGAVLGAAMAIDREVGRHSRSLR